MNIGELKQHSPNFVHTRDLAERAALDRRQRLEEERKKRIFDAKYRTIGLDVKTLGEQAELKTRMELEEKQRQLLLDEQLLETVKLMELTDQRIVELQKKRIRELQEYRHDYQQRVEIDPLVEAALPDTFGPSSLREFGGEDLSNDDRRRLQQQQVRDWADEQMRQKQQQRNHEKQEKHYQELLEQQYLLRRNELEMAEEAARMHKNLKVQEINAQLADERALREKQQRDLEELQRQQEIQENVNGTFLMEDPIAAAKSHGSDRVTVDAYKGMSPQQLASIRLEQEVQRKEHELLKYKEMLAKREDDLREAINQRTHATLTRQQHRLEKQTSLNVADQNKRLAEEQRLKNDQEKVLYRNRYEESFFNQFNTTSR